MSNQQNVFFMGVARIADGQAIIISSHSYNSETQLPTVKEVLQQPNMSLSAGKHYSFNVSTLAWHLIAGNLLLYVRF